MDTLLNNSGFKRYMTKFLKVCKDNGQKEYEELLTNFLKKHKYFLDTSVDDFKSYDELIQCLDSFEKDYINIYTRLFPIKALAQKNGVKIRDDHFFQSGQINYEQLLHYGELKHENVSQNEYDKRLERIEKIKEENDNLFRELSKIIDYRGVFGFTWTMGKITEYEQSDPREIVSIFRNKLADTVFKETLIGDLDFSYSEIETICDGVTVGGKSIEDFREVLETKDRNEHLFELINSRSFKLEIKQIPYNIISALESINNPLERGFIALLGILYQRKRHHIQNKNEWFLMNGIFMSNGLYAFSIPIDEIENFKNKLSEFYETKNADSILDFLSKCYEKDI